MFPSSWIDAIGQANSSGTRVNRPTTDWYNNSDWSPKHGLSLLSDPSSAPNSFLRTILGVNDPTSSENSSLSGPYTTSGSSGSVAYYPSPSAQQLDYLGADLAKHYGMDRTTAYNEAMANTAYQRAVADMQMAGLNPASLFSSGRASSAGSGYASGAAGGYSSARGASQEVSKLPGWLYYGVTSLAQLLGSAVTQSTSGGAFAGQIAQDLMKSFNSFNK